MGCIGFENGKREISGIKLYTLSTSLPSQNVCREEFILKRTVKWLQERYIMCFPGLEIFCSLISFRYKKNENSLADLSLSYLIVKCNICTKKENAIHFQIFVVNSQQMGKE